MQLEIGDLGGAVRREICDRSFWGYVCWRLALNVNALNDGLWVFFIMVFTHV